jgi:hypothetical protein
MNLTTTSGRRTTDNDLADAYFPADGIEDRLAIQLCQPFKPHPRQDGLGAFYRLVPWTGSLTQHHTVYVSSSRDDDGEETAIFAADGGRVRMDLILHTSETMDHAEALRSFRDGWELAVPDEYPLDLEAA